MIVTRQTERRAMFDSAMADVNEKNLDRVLPGHFSGLCRGMKRKARRALARAYAAGKWKSRPYVYQPGRAYHPSRPAWDKRPRSAA